MGNDDVSNGGPAGDGAQPPERNSLRLALKRLALMLGAVLILFVALIALVALVEIRIPLDWARARIESAASAASVDSGVHLKLRGPLALITGPLPALEARDLVIETRGEGGSIEFLRLGMARSGIELRALLSREVHLMRFSASDLVLRLDAGTFAAIAAARRTAEANVPVTPAAPSTDGWRFGGVSTLQVERARATIALPALTLPLEIGVDTLTLKAPKGSSLTIQASGTAAGQAMRVDYRGGRVADFIAGELTVPMDLRVAIADASFSGKGTLDLSTRRGDYHVELNGNRRYLERILPRFKAGRGDVNEVSIEGRLLTSPSGTRFEDATLVAGRTSAKLTLRQTLDNGRLRTQGRFEFELLDLTPWLPVFAATQGDEAADADVLGPIRALQRAMGVDFEVKAAQVIWPRRTANDVQFALRVTEDRVELESRARVLTGSLEANALLETGQKEATLRVDAQGGPIVLESLVPALERKGITATVRTAKLTGRGRGTSSTALVQSLEGELDLRDADGQYLPEQDAPPMRVKVKLAHLVATRDALQGSFEAAIEDARIALKLSSERAAVEADHRVVHSAFDMTVKRPRQRAHLRAQGALTLKPKTWAVDVKDARLGPTRGSATAKGSWDAKTPMSIHADFARFDVATMDFFDFGRRGKPRKAKRWQDVVVLPRGLRLPPMDLQLSAKRVDIEPARANAVRVTVRSRSGRLERSTFALRAKGGTLTGELSADFTGKVPRLDARVTGKSFDAQTLLARLGVKVKRARTQSLEMRYELRGKRLKEIVAASTMKIAAQGLDLAMPGLADARRTLTLRGTVDVASTKGRLSASVSGTLNKHKFSANSRGPELAALIARDERVSVDVTLNVADSTLEAHGTVAASPEADLRVRISGKRLDELLALGGLKTSLASAFSASTQFKLTRKQRYAFDKIDARTGESTITGRVLADLSAARPNFEATLASPSLRLIDIGGGIAKEVVRESRGAALKAKEVPWLASLRRYDAKIDLNAKRLFAAGEWLGPVRFKARLKAGRLQISPLEIRSKDGSLVAHGSVVAPRGAADPSFGLIADLKQFNLTPVLRALDPEGKKGTAILDARAVLRSRGLGKTIVENLDGTLDIASYASGVGAGQLDMMGINVLSIAQDTLDPESGSKLNCAVGVFDIGKGLMKSRALFADTTRMRIIGNLDLDLRARTLDGGLRPFPKNPALFRISTPVDISGTFDAPRVSLATTALPELLIRFSNPYTLFLGTLVETRSSKADGSDDCRAAFEKAKFARSEVGANGKDADDAAKSPLQRLEDVVTPKGDQ